MALGRIDFRENRKRKEVYIEELDGSFTVAALTVGQVKKLKEGDEDNVLRQLAMGLIDPDTGRELYDVENPEHIEILGAMPLSVFKPLIDALNEINGTPAKDIEDAKKNLRAIPSTYSASA